MADTSIAHPPVTDWTTDWDHLDPKWRENPYPIWDSLRPTCPIAHTQRYQGAYLPTRYDDVREAGTSFEITGPPENLDRIRKALGEAGIEFQSADVTNLATTTVTLEPDVGGKAFRLLQALDDHDDVESTDTNLEVTDELLAAVEGDDQ